MISAAPACTETTPLPARWEVSEWAIHYFPCNHVNTGQNIFLYVLTFFKASICDHVIHSCFSSTYNYGTATYNYIVFVCVQVSTPVTSSPLTSPLTIATQHSSPRKTTATLIQNQQIMLQLLQSYMLQQQRVQLAQQASNHQLPTSQTTTAKQPAITTQASSSSHQNKEMDERDLHTSVLDNFLTEGGDKSTGVSNMFYTSSDTVNKLLQGLSSVKPSESIQKLSEETADVLPTFAKALGNSFLTSAGPSQESPPNEHPGDNEGDGTEHKDDQAGVCWNVF